MKNLKPGLILSFSGEEGEVMEDLSSIPCPQSRSKLEPRLNPGLGVSARCFLFHPCRRCCSQQDPASVTFFLCRNT